MFSRLSPPSRLLPALVLGLALTGNTSCSRFTKTRQCRALIAQVNPALDEVTALTDAGAAASGGTSAANAGGARYIAAAARYERLAKDLGPMEFSSEQMAKTVAEYASVLSATAQNLRALGTAVDANNNAEAERANRELEKLTVREHAAIARIDAWCAPDS